MAVELLVLNWGDAAGGVLYIAVDEADIRVGEQVLKETLWVVGLKVLVEAVSADFQCVL